MVRMKVPGSVYRRANGRWIALSPEVYDADREEWRRIGLGTYGTRAEAEIELKRFNESISSSRALSSAEIRGMRVDRYLDNWLELVAEQRRTGVLAASTASGYESAVRLHIKPVMGRRRIKDLDERVVVDWLAGLKRKGLADRTVLRVYRTAHRAFADSRLAQNPVRLPKHLRPKVRQERPTYRPSAEEVKVFLEHVSACPQSGFLYPLWRMAATTGMRRGELVGLDWTDVDLESARLRVERSVVMDGSQLIVKAPKSRAGKRVLGLDGEMLDLLRTSRADQAANQARPDYEELPMGLDLVFRWNERGEICRPDRVSHAFSSEWAHAGLPTRATLHSLRHFLGSLLLVRGHSVTETAQQLGHDPNVLLAVYAGVLDQSERIGRISSTVAEVFSS